MSTSTTAPQKPLASATDYIGWDWAVIALHTPDAEGRCSCGNKDCQKPGKHPRFDAENLPHGCYSATLDSDVVEQWEQQWQDANIGVATGAVSGIWVLDCDGAPGLRTLARLEKEHNGDLPHTPRQRTGGGGEQLIFNHVPGLKNAIKFADGLDVRTDGGLFVAPASLHASGRRYAWIDGSRPDQVPVADAPEWLIDLIKEAGKAKTREPVPEGAKIQDGERNDTLFRIGCAMRRHGVIQKTILAALTEENKARCKPPLSLDEIAEIAANAASYRPATSHSPSSNGKSPEPEPEQESLTAIETSARRLRDKTSAALRVLLARNKPPAVFIRGGALVRVGIDEDGRAGIQRLTPAMVRNRLDRCANWMSTVTVKGVTTTKPVAPPKDVVDDLMALPSWPGVPALTGIVTAPVVSKEAVLLTSPGYHPSCCLYYHTTGLGELPDSNPTAAAIDAAKRLLLDQLLGDFPFADDASKAHALALILEPFVRPLIDNPTPLYAIDAPCPGTGKTLLAMLGTGVFVPNGASVMVEGRNEDEWRKRITSTLLGGPAHILIDNIKQPLHSGVLSGALTARVWEDRLLGYSENAALPVRCTWIATGNNLVLSDEIARRSVWIRLNADVERPWLREKFDIPHIALWAAQQRPQLIAASLTLIRAWLEGGQQQFTGQVPGSIDHWGRILGGILQKASVPGFLENKAALYDQVDAGREMWVEFLTACRQRHGEQAFGVSEVFWLAEQSAIAAELGEGTDRARKTRLGILLRGACDRIYGDHQLKRAAPVHGAAHYRVAVVDRAL